MFNRQPTKPSQKALDLCKRFEGCEKKLKNGNFIAYLDTIGTGTPWTIGYGSTGPGIEEGTIWTQAQCDKALMAEMQSKCDQVCAYLKVPVNQNQLDALTDAAYNLGVHGMHTVLDAINEGDNDKAMALLLNHNHSQGVVRPGLTRRRYAEKELFEWETPKEVKQLSPQLQTADTVQTATGVGAFSIAGMWNYLPQVKEFMADHNGMILLGVVGIVFGVTYLWKRGFHIAFNDGTYVPVGTKPVDEVPNDASA